MKSFFAPLCALICILFLAPQTHASSHMNHNDIDAFMSTISSSTSTSEASYSREISQVRSLYSSYSSARLALIKAIDSLSSRMDIAVPTTSNTTTTLTSRTTAPETSHAISRPQPISSSSSILYSNESSDEGLHVGVQNNILPERNQSSHRSTYHIPARFSKTSSSRLSRFRLLGL